VSSFLLLSPSKDILDAMKAQMSSPQVRVRQVLDLDHAKKWLELNPSIKGVFIDQVLPAEEVVSFIIECWSKSPELVCALVSPKTLDESYRPALTLGIENCCGLDFERKIADLIKKIPEKISITRIRQHTAVLVVEDLDSPRDIICALIESLGYSEVIGVSRVNEGIEILSKEPFRFFCVVTDINMPHRTGHSLIREIRETFSIAYLPIIVLTSDPSEANLLEAIKTGVTGFLAKPPKKVLLRGELEKAKRLVMLGKSPEIGTPEEIHLLEEVLKKRNKK
jgi:CheY-like chemotaxis protein